MPRAGQPPASGWRQQVCRGFVLAAMCLSLVLIAGFVGLNALVVMPVNPLKIALKPLISVTVERHMPQNWGLFAPNPLSTNYLLLVHPLVDAVPAEKVLSLPADGRYDLTTSLVQRFQSNRISAYDRVGRTIEGPIRLYNSGTPDLHAWQKGCKAGDQVACDVCLAGMQRARTRALAQLERVASAFCNCMDRAGQQYGYFALRLRAVKAIPWSHRDFDRPVTTDYDLGVYAIDRKVTPMPIYDPGANQ